MMVIEILEQYVWPFLLACATLLVLLNTQRISGQNWTEPLVSTMRIIIALWILNPAPQYFFTQKYCSTLFDEVVQDEDEAESSTHSIRIEESLHAVTPSPDAPEVHEISDISSYHIAETEEDI